jgi:hypothetical protein
MDDLRFQLESQAIAYAKSRGTAIHFQNPLGFGTDGCVWKTNRNSAVKVFEREANYQRERDCYRRLKSRGIQRCGRFEIPRLIDCDDVLLVVEMGIVSPPFLLDFAKAHLDRPPDFSPEVMAEWEAQQVEWFGDRWPQIRSALYTLERIGIYYRDVRPGNILFAEDTECS